MKIPVPDEYIPDDFKPNKFDVNDLLTKSLNNENNESIMKLDKTKISKYKNDILQQLQLPREKLKEFNKKLKDYRYVSDMADLNYGSFIRWINLNKVDDIKITKGGVIVDIKFYSSGVIIQCKNFRNTIFTLKFDECLIFQKLTLQESVLLDVIDYIKI